MQTTPFFFTFFFLLLVLQLSVSISLLKKEIKNTIQKMGEIKIGLWILQVSGFSCWLWGIIDNWGDAKSLVLFVMGLAFGGYKLYNIHMDTAKKKLNLTISGVKLRKRDQIILKWTRN